MASNRPTFSHSRAVNVFNHLNEPTPYFTKGKEIGSGSYGKVFIGVHIRTGIQVAIKELNVQSNRIEESMKEILILKDHCKDPNICQFLGAFVIRGKSRDQNHLIWLVMEYCMYGSAKDLINLYETKRARIPEEYVVYVIKGVIYGLRYLHSKSIVHRDIKSPNILFDRLGTVKIADFGISASLNNGRAVTNAYIGTTYWMAPEVMKCRDDPLVKYDTKCDIWSTGITAIEISEGEPPLLEKDTEDAMDCIMSIKPYKFSLKIFRSAQLHNFIKLCLVKDQNNRPTAVDMCNHKLIKNFLSREKKVQHSFLKVIQKYSNCSQETR